MFGKERENIVIGFTLYKDKIPTYN